MNLTTRRATLTACEAAGKWPSGRFGGVSQGVLLDVQPAAAVLGDARHAATRDDSWLELDDDFDVFHARLAAESAAESATDGGGARARALPPATPPPTARAWGAAREVWAVYCKRRPLGREERALQRVKRAAGAPAHHNSNYSIGVARSAHDLVRWEVPGGRS